MPTLGIRTMRSEKGMRLRMGMKIRMRMDEEMFLN